MGQASEHYTNGDIVSVFYPPNLESKSGATFPPVFGSGPPISDSSFPLCFGLLSPLGRKFC